MTDGTGKLAPINIIPTLKNDWRSTYGGTGKYNSTIEEWRMVEVSWHRLIGFQPWRMIEGQHIFSIVKNKKTEESQKIIEIRIIAKKIFNNINISFPLCYFNSVNIWWSRGIHLILSYNTFDILFFKEYFKLFIKLIE